MDTWVQIVLIWAVAAVIIHLVHRKRYDDYRETIQSIPAPDSYKTGFKEGANCIKLYYTIVGTFPSTEWIVKNCHKKLDTREKILATLSEEELNGLHEHTVN
jgi:hypothetical protein